MHPSFECYKNQQTNKNGEKRMRVIPKTTERRKCFGQIKNKKQQHFVLLKNDKKKKGRCRNDENPFSVFKKPNDEKPFKRKRMFESFPAAI
jgi:hypothetical protein